MSSILLHITGNGDSKFKCEYLKNDSLFLKILFHFRNLHQISNILKKKMMVIANVFTKLLTVKILVRPLSIKCPFRKDFDRQHVKVSEILPKSPWQPIYHVCSSFWGKLIWKTFPLMLGQILRVFVDTLPADVKYPAEYYESFRLPIQMQLPEKRKRWSQVFVPVLQST